MSQTTDKLQKRLAKAREQLGKIAKKGKLEETRAARKHVKRMSRKIASLRTNFKNAARSRKKAD